MIAVVTGARGGIGAEVARSLAAAGHRVIGLGRDQCDLASLSAVAATAEQLQSNQIDVLINNAGVAGRRGMTRDGFELAFGVNYLSHYLLTRKLQGHGVRVVNVSSEAHRSVSSLDLSGVLGRTRSIWGWREYALSKACQIAFTLELAAQGVEAFSVHPGLIATGLWRPVPRPFRWLVVRGMAPPAVGALPVIRAALDRELPSGSYVTPSGVMEPSAVISDQKARTRLWNQSERWVGEYLA